MNLDAIIKKKAAEIAANRLDRVAFHHASEEIQHMAGLVGSTIVGLGASAVGTLQLAMVDPAGNHYTIDLLPEPSEGEHAVGLHMTDAGAEKDFPLAEITEPVVYIFASEDTITVIEKEEEHDSSKDTTD